MQIRRTAAALTCAAAMSVTGVAMATPASAALVDANVVLVDVVDVNNNNILAQVPIGVAAAVCDVNAAVLLAAIQDTGDATCTAVNTSRARGQQRQ